MQTRSAINARTTEARATGAVSSRVAGRTPSAVASTGAEAPARVAGRLRLEDLRPCVFKVRYLHEEFEALVDLLPRDGLQTLSPESLNGERSHHAAIEHRLAEDGGRHLPLRREKAVEPPRTRIPATAGLHHLRQRQSHPPACVA